MIYSFQFNALNQGDFTAKSLGVNVNMLRFVSLLLASLCTAVCISFVGIIGFLGILAPHIVRRIIGNDYRYLIPGSALMGALILLSSDLLSKVILKDLSLPVGAITSLFGAPFFLYIIFRRKENLN
jgi:iron complex transport system permease protein